MATIYAGQLPEQKTWSQALMELLQPTVMHNSKMASDPEYAMRIADMQEIRRRHLAGREEAIPNPEYEETERYYPPMGPPQIGTRPLNDTEGTQIEFAQGLPPGGMVPQLPNVPPTLGTRRVQDPYGVVAERYQNEKRAAAMTPFQRQAEEAMANAKHNLIRGQGEEAFAKAGKDRMETSLAGPKLLADIYGKQLTSEGQLDSNATQLLLGQMKQKSDEFVTRQADLASRRLDEASRRSVVAENMNYAKSLAGDFVTLYGEAGKTNPAEPSTAPLGRKLGIVFSTLEGLNPLLELHAKNPHLRPVYDQMRVKLSSQAETDARALAGSIVSSPGGNPAQKLAKLDSLARQLSTTLRSKQAYVSIMAIGSQDPGIARLLQSQGGQP